jgi:S1-C subfamily serine protease
LPLTALIVVVGIHALRSRPASQADAQSPAVAPAQPPETTSASPLREFLAPAPTASVAEAAEPPAAAAAVGTAIPLAELVRRTVPAVVTIQAGRGSGSGFFVAQDAIVTNNHVVGNAASVTVHLYGGGRLEGRVVQTAPTIDLAIVRVSSGDRVRPVLEVRPTGTVQVGEEVVAIGSPGFGARALEATVTRGVISGVRSLAGVMLLQTDAALNPGNSGGPLLDMAGRVVGITTAKARGSESIGFAVAGDYALALLQGRGTEPVRALLKQASATGGLERWQPPSPAEGDQTRADGRQAFEAQAAALTRPVAQFTRMVERFRDQCVSEQAVGSSALRNATWQDAARWIDNDAAVSPDCLSFRSQIRTLRTDIATALDAAQEQARRAGVYPGEVRDVLRRHGLDWDGWGR